MDEETEEEVEVGCDIGGATEDDEEGLFECIKCQTWQHTDCYHEDGSGPDTVHICGKCESNTLAILRCVCDEEHDDGGIVEFQKCQTWQHRSCLVLFFLGYYREHRHSSLFWV